MSLPLLIAPLVVVWLLMLAGCWLSIRWSSPVQNRRWRAYLPAIAAVIVSVVGLRSVNVVASETVNGQVRWRFDSAWLFWSSLVVGVMALAWVAYRQYTSRQLIPAV